jgi:hypothetical protein
MPQDASCSSLCSRKLGEKWFISPILWLIDYTFNIFPPKIGKPQRFNEHQSTWCPIFAKKNKIQANATSLVALLGNL